MPQHSGSLHFEAASTAALGSTDGRRLVSQCCTHVTIRNVPICHRDFSDMCGAHLLSCIGMDNFFGNTFRTQFLVIESCFYLFADLMHPLWRNSSQQR